MASKKPMITVVGCGPGGRDYLTKAAMDSVDNAELVIGATRLLEMFPDIRATKIELDTKISRALDLMEDKLKGVDVTVLVSGDPGLFSLSNLIIKRFGRDKVKVIPGVSSVQAAFALLGLPWSSALTLSAHKGPPEMSLEEILSHDPIAVLSGWGGVSQWLAELMSHEGADNRAVYVCENLTCSEEKVFQITLDEIQSASIKRNSVIVIVSGSTLE